MFLAKVGPVVPMYAAAALALVAAIQPITAFLIQDQYGITDVAEITYVSGIALFSMAIVTLVVQIAVLQVWKLQPAVLLRVGFLVFGVAMIFFAFADSLLMLYLSFAGMGVAFALSTPGRMRLPAWPSSLKSRVRWRACWRRHRHSA